MNPESQRVSPRFLIVQMVGLILFIVSWWQGWPQMLYAGDATFITPAIGLLTLCGLAAFATGRHGMVEYLIRALPRYGLFGTVVGLSIVAANSGGDFQVILGGMSVAFFTTVAGLLGSEWLRITRNLS